MEVKLTLDEKVQNLQRKSDDVLVKIDDLLGYFNNADQLRDLAASQHKKDFLDVLKNDRRNSHKLSETLQRLSLLRKDVQRVKERLKLRVEEAEVRRANGKKTTKEKKQQKPKVEQNVTEDCSLDSSSQKGRNQRRQGSFDSSGMSEQQFSKFEKAPMGVLQDPGYKRPNQREKPRVQHHHEASSPTRTEAKPGSPRRALRSRTTRSEIVLARSPGNIL